VATIPETMETPVLPEDGPEDVPPPEELDELDEDEEPPPEDEPPPEELPPPLEELEDDEDDDEDEEDDDPPPEDDSEELLIAVLMSDVKSVKWSVAALRVKLSELSPLTVESRVVPVRLSKSVPLEDETVVGNGDHERVVAS
jgi:hypothetical protein